MFLEIKYPIKCHFLLCCLHIKQDDGEGLNIERDSSLKMYANGKLAVTKSGVVTHTDTDTHSQLTNTWMLFITGSVYVQVFAWGC